MFIGSASAPIMNSWIASQSMAWSPEPDFFHHIPKPHSISLISSHSHNFTCKIMRATSENLAVPNQNPLKHGLVVEEEKRDSNVNWMYFSMDPFVSSSVLDELVEEDACVGGGVGSNSGDGCRNFNNASDSTDDYYRKMIESDPGNGLFLGNYAKFLKQVRGDLVKAEEFYERAILANPDDGNIVSLYAELTWELHRDASRAEKYFHQALQIEQNNCYVMASYARFLWDTEEDEQ